MRFLRPFLLSLLLVAPAMGQIRNAADYERLLLPFQASTPAFRGIWRVEWWLRNDSSVAVDAFPFGCSILPPAYDLFSIAAAPALPAQFTPTCFASDALPTFRATPSIPVRNSVGAFLYVLKGSSGLTASGSLWWDANPDRSQPSPLQAVPEAAFRAGSGSILPVPISPATRYALRVFALPESVDDPRVTIRIFEVQPQLLPDSRERLFTAFEGELRAQDATLAPCSNMCDLPDVEYAPAIVEFFNIPLPPRGDLFQSPMRVEITPHSINVRWWAIVSATDNQTQQVRLFQPSFQ